MADTAGPLWARILWFVGLWMAGVGAIAAGGLVIRWVLL